MCLKPDFEEMLKDYGCIPKVQIKDILQAQKENEELKKMTEKNKKLNEENRSLKAQLKKLEEAKATIEEEKNAALLAASKLVARRTFNVKKSFQE